MDQNILQEAFQHFFTDERKKIIIIASNGNQLYGCKPIDQKEFDLSPYDIEKGQNVEFYQYADGEEVALVKEKDQYYQLKNNKKIPFSHQTKSKEVDALLAKINENLNEGEQKTDTPRIHCVITDYASKFQYFGTKTENEFFQDTKTHQEIFDIYEIIKDHIETALKNDNNGTYVKFDQVNTSFIFSQQINISKTKSKRIDSRIQLKPIQMENESQNVEFEIALSDCIQKIEDMKGSISVLQQSDQQLQANTKKIKELDTSVIQLKTQETKVKNLEQNIKNLQDETKKQNKQIQDIESIYQGVNNRVENLENQNSRELIEEYGVKIQKLEEQIQIPQNMRATQPSSDIGSKQLENRIQNKIAQLEQRITNLEQNQQKQQLSKQSNENVLILQVSQLQYDGQDAEGFCYKYSDVCQGGISRLELKVSDDEINFEIGVVKSGDISKIKQLGHSYRFEFPDGNVIRGDVKKPNLISYYPMVDTQIGLEVNTIQSLLSVYINGVKNISINLTSTFSEFSYYVKTSSDDQIKNVFEFEDQSYLKY